MKAPMKTQLNLLLAKRAIVSGKSCPGCVNAWTEWQKNFLFAIRFLTITINDNAMFYKTLFKRNYKEMSAHLPDKHFECCIFNIVQHHQTFVNKD